MKGNMARTSGVCRKLVAAVDVLFLDRTSDVLVRADSAACFRLPEAILPIERVLEASCLNEVGQESLEVELNYSRV